MIALVNVLVDLSPNDLKLITAVFVFFALIVPQFLRKSRLRSAHA